MTEVDGALEIQSEHSGATLTVHAAGEIDLANADALAAELHEAERAGAEAIVLDLTKLEFIDSTGIALIVAIHQRLNDGGASRFRLAVGPEGPVRRLLELTGVEARVPIA